MAISLKPTLTLTSTSGASGVSEDSSLALSVADTLTVTDPMIGISRVQCTTTGGDTIILPNTTTTRYVYIKNTGLTGADASDTAEIASGVTVKVELADNTRIVDLSADEFCFFPYNAEGSGYLQLEASADTVVVEYGYWTKV
tara:strand:+ start:40 stop:465 length:426 start_codon:yes stop_codon:yes gene_type:complete